MCSEEYRRRFAFLCKAILNSKWIGRQHLSFFFLSFFLLMILLLWFKWGSWSLVFVESVPRSWCWRGSSSIFHVVRKKKKKRKTDPRLSWISQSSSRPTALPRDCQSDHLHSPHLISFTSVQAAHPLQLPPEHRHP